MFFCIKNGIRRLRRHDPGDLERHCWNHCQTDQTRANLHGCAGHPDRRIGQIFPMTPVDWIAPPANTTQDESWANFGCLIPL